MYNNKKISLVIPCNNEQEGLKNILQNKPLFIDEVIVVDNNSIDRTADITRNYRTRVVHEKKEGMGGLIKQAYRKPKAISLSRRMGIIATLYLK